MAVSWRGAYGTIEDGTSLRGVHALPGRPTAGHVLGIITVDLDYPKLPGNVANASTFPFPVLYENLSFEIEQLFAGDESLRQLVIDAALKLEASGVRAIIGACGYFAHFQKDVAAAVHIPVFLSSLCQLPLIRTWLPQDKRILVLCADGASVDDALLSNVDATTEGLIVQDVGHLESFAPIRWSHTELDSGLLERDLCELACAVCHEHESIEAVLLECSDLPPYAAAIQRACGLPVYDFLTLAHWVADSVLRTDVFGYF